MALGGGWYSCKKSYIVHQEEAARKMCIRDSVGRVCMDQTLCDVTAIPAAVPGCEAVLIGSGLDAAAVAGAAETIPNELLSRLGVRVQRVYRMLS